MSTVTYELADCPDDWPEAARTHGEAVSALLGRGWCTVPAADAPAFERSLGPLLGVAVRRTES